MNATTEAATIAAVGAKLGADVKPVVLTTLQNADGR